MKTIQGTYTTAQIMTDDVEQYAIAQVKVLCDNPIFKDEKIVCMPDIHPGKVTPIGFTATIDLLQNKIIMPNLIGNDIGCGILAVKLKETRFEPQKLDRVIRENIPSGLAHRKDNYLYNKYIRDNFDTEYMKLNCCISDKCIKSFGTLGGGNHFIEIDKDPDDDSLWLIIHTGSRAFGTEINKYYLDLAHKNNPVIPYELGVLVDQDAYNYHDDHINACYFASANRVAIADIIIKEMKFHPLYNIESIHNDIKGGDIFIIRKGATNADKGKTVIIPINSRDGIIIGKGKGNPDWNYSAPHGSGRIMNRTDTKNQHTLSEYKKSMNGIYSSSINAGTLDEAPFAYRSIDQILPLIQDTVEVTKILKPVYNFKGGKE